MHNKYAIIDDIIVITGSFNWTDHAIKCNYENVIINQGSFISPKNSGRNV